MIRPGTTLGLLLALIGCAGAGGEEPPPAPVVDPAPAIVEMLQASAESWSRGDLDGFLDDYLDTVGTTFVGGSGVVRGTDEIRQRYQTGYWSTGRPEHRLGFDDLEVRALGADHALVLGRYVLTVPESGETAGTGIFSLVLARTGTGWKIIHDHSSATPTP